MDSQKHRIALLVQYDGTEFNGWQYQNRGRTVQSEIEKAVNILTKISGRVSASGRTDAGVHALGQVAHFDIPSDCDLQGTQKLQKFCKSLNGILPRDISIVNAYNVPCDFHSRFSAVEREYLYIIFNRPQKSPFMYNRAMWLRDKIDPEYIRKTASYIVGEKDFAAFCKKTSADENSVRRIDRIAVDYKNDTIYFKIIGNAFLHNMIRIIIGTLVEMYYSNADPAYINEIISSKDRDKSGTTAPAYGLYLKRIKYDPPLDSMESAY